VTRFSIIEKHPEWLNDVATEHHYMHRPVHQRAVPFGWAVGFDGDVYQADGRPNGFIVYCSIHYTRLTGEFGYPGLPTKWQVLSLARLWLHPDLQTGGALYSPDILPGFMDRKGIFRSTLATDVIKQSFEQVQDRWLEVHPPRFLDEPYHILKIISYADTRYFSGQIYRAAGFRETGRTVSARRHKNTRGDGMDGAELIRFVYDLPEPVWFYQPLQMQFSQVTS
jgi:hypothetical protein